MADRAGFLRQNAFLVAAVALPLVVVAFFLAASIVPRWFVDPPAYDLVLRTDGGYERGRPPVAVTFHVRDGRVEAVVRGVPAESYPQAQRLFLFEHETMSVREIGVDVPTDLTETDPPVTLVVSALADRRVSSQTTAPDGYQLGTRGYRSRGLVGELFGMGSSSSDRVTLVNDGRTVAVRLPERVYGYSVSEVGWVIDPEQD